MKEEELIKKINFDRVPKHVAIIMDGNGRWAKKKGMMRSFGHKNAIKAVRAAIEGANEVGIPYVTLYAFSSENWSRPFDEVNFLMNLLIRSLKKELNTFKENDIQLRTIGDVDRLPKEVFEELQKVKEETKDNKKAILTLALSYGAKDEILNAVKDIAQDVKEDKIEIDKITPELFKSYLFNPDIPDVDLMIRTSGEQRISNFLLWQMAYAELYFTDILWPDFRRKDLYQAVIEYQNRQRRFGKTGDQITN
ncbi:isoprenyl transferase [Flavobacteriaceae bacterium Ap0902]|nr:isoprenyl transferase [Flavobacteriaceae bacterium Ap0902]